MTDSELESAIADAQLPSAITGKIRRFLSESGLRGEARRELLGELVSHFEEGLASGKRIDELVAAFGDEGHAACLMSRVGPNWEKKMLESPETSVRGEGVIVGSLRDARLAVRRLVATPGFTLVAILSLALGIGANTAIFTLVNAVLLRELPLREPERLVDVYISLPEEPYLIFCYPEYRDFVERTGEVFESVAASRILILSQDQGGDVEMALAEAVTGNFFGTLGVRAALGRTLGAEDHVSPGAHPVVVLGDGYWRRAFGADPDVIGRSIRLSGRPFTVVGVLEPSYTGSFRGLEPSAYVPMMMINQLQPGTRDSLEEYGEHGLFVKARLRPGVGRARADAVAQGVAADFAERRIENWASGGEFRLIATEDVVIYPPLDRFVRAAAWLLMIVAGLVLLLACTNLAGVQLARAVDRRREIAVKLALGASRRSLVRQLVTEAVVLALVAGVAGLVVASVLLRTLLSADLPVPLPVTLDLRLDGTVLAFSAGISLLAGIFFGIVPALRATDTDVASTLRDETAGGGGAASSRLRGALVVAQVAISLVLVIGAALFLRSMQQLQKMDPGFGNDPSAIMTLAILADRYTPEAGRAFMRTFARSHRADPRCAGGGDDRESPPQHAEHDVDRRQRRWLRATRGARRLPDRQIRGRCGLLRGCRHPHPQRAQLRRLRRRGRPESRDCQRSLRAPLLAGRRRGRKGVPSRAERRRARATRSDRDREQCGHSPARRSAAPVRLPALRAGLRELRDDRGAHEPGSEADRPAASRDGAGARPRRVDLGGEDDGSPSRHRAPPRASPRSSAHCSCPSLRRSPSLSP